VSVLIILVIVSLGAIGIYLLINHDLITEEHLKQAFETGAFNNCPKYVEDVTGILDKLL